MLSREDAIGIAGKYIDELENMFPNRILAAYVIGSLGSDYYRPGQSDIDVAVITDFTRDDVQDAIRIAEELAERYWKRYEVPKGFGSILFAEEQLYPPYVAEEELVLEVLRLKTQSKCLRGTYDIASIPFPAKQDIIDDARHFQSWIDEETAKNPSFRISSVQMLINSTLIALKRYLMIKHNIIEFNKFKVIDLYMNNCPPLVNDAVFDFINDELRGQHKDISDAEFEIMIQWHDELYKTVNNMTIYA